METVEDQLEYVKHFEWNFLYGNVSIKCKENYFVSFSIKWKTWAFLCYKLGRVLQLSSSRKHPGDKDSCDGEELLMEALGPTTTWGIPGDVIPSEIVDASGEVIMKLKLLTPDGPFWLEVCNNFGL